MASIKSKTANTFWQNHVGQWQSSGLSQAKYCRQHKLTSHQFSYWKGKFWATGHAAMPGTNSGFARVQIAWSTDKAVLPGLSLRFQDGTEVTGITRDTMPLIRELVEVLR